MSLSLLHLRRLRALATVFAGVALAAASAQCDIYGPWLLLPGDASADGANTGNGGHAYVPARPTGVEGSTGPGPYSNIAAMQSIDLGLGDGGAVPDGALPPFGWDLDNDITCPGMPSCEQMPGTKENCDDQAGRDHTGLYLFRELGLTAKVGVAAVNQAMQAGEYGLLVGLSQYNGTMDDDRVTVSLYFSSGVLGTGDGGGVVLNHDGNDRWTVDPRSLQGAPTAGVDCSNGATVCQPNFVDDNAYVTDGTLVSTGLGEIPITFGGRANIGGAVMDLNETILVGTLQMRSRAGGGVSWAIVGGSISGRWGSAKLLTNMATIPDPTSDSGAFLCGNDPAYLYLKNHVICALQDIPVNPMNDNTGAPCDAISMAFAFTAEPALLGTVSPLPATPSGCSQGSTPFNDSCQ
jgi:hypothetical protein